MQDHPTKQIVTVSEARKQFSTLANRVTRKETRVLIEKRGAPVVALVSAEDLARLEELDVRRDRDYLILREIGDAFSDVPQDELQSEVSKALSQARAEMRSSKSEPLEGTARSL